MKIIRQPSLIRLALANAVGFGASTVMPLWIGGIAERVDAAPWFAGAAASAQLAGAAIFNLSTPVLFRGQAPLQLARVAMVVAGAAALLQLTGHAAMFMAACIVCGSSLGIVLNSTNRILARSAEVHKGYAVFQLTEVCFAALLFGLSGALAARIGVGAIFFCVAAACAGGLMLLRGLPVEHIETALIHRARAPGNRFAASLGLAALAVFFMGQSAVNSYMVPIGQAKGIPAGVISSVIALTMCFGFAGALLARVVGERFGGTAPVIGVAGLLACVFLAVTRMEAVAVFVVGAAVLAACTMFVVPYFFTMLARLDPNGLYASIAPALLLTGVAAGPSIAVTTALNFTLSALGLLAGALVLFGAFAFSLCARLAAGHPKASIRRAEDA